MSKVIFDTDSYKVSHWKQYPKNADYAMSYIEARGGTDVVLLTQILPVVRKIVQAVTLKDIAKAELIFERHFGTLEFFNREGWEQVAKLGYLPLEIRGIEEGSIVPSKVPLITVRNTIPGFAWLVSWVETALLRVWYPITVATNSYKIKQVIYKYLKETGDVAGLPFKLHSFACRGVSTEAQAALGDSAHLSVFWGTDTLPGILHIVEEYDEIPNAYSIAASEHSTITSWTEEFEIDAYKNMIEQFGGEGKIYACVSDSYNIWKALEMWKSLEPEIIAKGGTLVIRPDSGDPIETPVAVVKRLLELFGCKTNAKGYKVLPDYIRVIQGDGVNIDSIEAILEALKEAGISADNIAFGMGGALLHAPGRDDFKFAMKCCAVWASGADTVTPVFKDPITDKGKASKKGLLYTVNREAKSTYSLSEYEKAVEESDMKVIYVDGYLNTDVSFSEIFDRANAEFTE